MGSEAVGSAASTAGLPFVVGIGASASGLEAIERFFGAMPPAPDMAFVLVEHLSPEFESFMPELLGRVCALPIETVTHSTLLKPATIHLASPGCVLELDGEHVRCAEPGTEMLPNQKVTHLFRTLARSRAEACAAVVLSGAGSGENAGLLDVHAAGGLVLVQDGASPSLDGTPRASLLDGVVDQVLAPEQMAAVLIDHVGHLARDAHTHLGSALPELYERVRHTHGIDLGLYRAGTIRRRLAQRAAAASSGGVALETYLAHALASPRELDEIVSDVLVGVTHLFRDAAALELLRARAIVPLLDEASSEREIRVWVAGCSTGAEAYTLAMLFLDEIERGGRRTAVRVLASDVNRRSLEIAGRGIYPRTALAGVPPRYLRFFVDEDDDHVRVTPALRESVLFSAHDLLADPPFTRIALVSCRNLLIYLEPRAQERALSAFGFALDRGGILFLGPSESLGEEAGDYEAIDAGARIFRRVTGRRARFRNRGSLAGTRSSALKTASDPRIPHDYDALLAMLVPSGVLVDQQGSALHVFGDAARYLVAPTGRVTTDLAALVRPDLRQAFLSAMEVARREALRASSTVTGLDGSPGVEVIVEPVPPLPTGPATFLVRLRELEARDAHAARPAAVTVDAPAEQRFESLERELADARLKLHATVEQLEAANEELQATNEELQSSNEELQATNEELQSVNEELYAINEQHGDKIQELDRVAGNLHNLMQETDVGVVFTDRVGAVRLFTQAALATFNLLPQDVGRPLAHITSRIPGDDVLEVVERVARNGSREERRVSAPDGRVLLRRVQPYRDVARDVGGVMISFVDVTALDRAEQELRRLNDRLEERAADRAAQLAEREERLAAVTGAGVDGYVIVDVDVAGVEKVEYHGFHATLGLPPDTRLDSAGFIDLVHEEDRLMFPRLREKRLRLEPIDVEVRMRSKDGWRTLSGRSVVFRRADGSSRTVFIYGDVTALRRAEAELAALNQSLEKKVEERTTALLERERAFRTMIESLPDGVLVVDAAGRVRVSNGRAAEIFGLPSDASLVGTAVESLVPDEARAGHADRVATFVAEGDARRMASGRVVRGARHDGRPIALEIGITPIVLGGERLGLARVTDVSDRVRAENELKRSEARFRKSFRSSLLGQVLLDAEGVVLEANPALSALLDTSETDLVGTLFSALVHPDDRRLEGPRREDAVHRSERRLRRRDGSFAFARVSVVPLRETEDAAESTSAVAMALVEDVSELRAAQDQQRATERKLQEAAKLESLGVLAGGIAHDFNNIIAGVLGNAQHARTIVEHGEVAECLDDVVLSCRRAAEICAQMLAYSGRSAFVRSDVDLSALVRDTERMLKLAVHKQVDLDLGGLALSLPVVSVDRAQLQQVVMNLLINASEAIGPRRGTIRVSTRVAPPELVDEGMRDVPWVMLQIEDDGVGIPPEHLSRIFEPFFSTKMQGRGLGLAAVQGIVHAHQGVLRVHSREGAGTTFQILLPSAGPAVATAARAIEQGSIAPRKGAGTVLVVDDEEPMRRLAQRILQSQGFTVVVAPDGQAALERFRAAPSRYDVVLLDLTMPVLDGARTFQAMREIDPDVKVVLMSGYSESEATRELDASELVGFLQKPIDRKDLIDRVRGALEPGPS